jgi:hypothetical protein
MLTRCANFISELKQYLLKLSHVENNIKCLAFSTGLIQEKVLRLNINMRQRSYLWQVA